MNLEEIKNLITSIEVSDEAREKLNAILDAGVKKGGLGKEDKERFLAILDLEIEAANLEADAREDVAAILEQFVAELDESAKSIERELVKTSEDFSAKIQRSNPQSETVEAS